MNPNNSKSDGEVRASLRQRRVWRAMFVPGLVAVAILYAAKQAFGGATFATSPSLALVGVVVLALFTLIGAIWHHSVIDEHEERAILWANTVGLYTVVASAFAFELLELSGLIEPVSHVVMMLPGFAAALLTYFWLRFR